ncbi:MAG: hypothetical protein JNL30_00135 [Rubrivivax sp.]|nr:hypothetical protein [Rubrivivax sp.]
MDAALLAAVIEPLADLLGAAAARVAGEPATPGAAWAVTAAHGALAASTAPAAPAPPAAEDNFAKELTQVLVWLGIATVVAAQLAAGWVLRRYRRRLLGFMGAASRKALGLAALDDEPPWSAPRLLAAMEGQRRLVLAILVTMVLLYSLAAGLAWGYGSARYNVLSHAVSVAMFTALTAPVVLLGVSAANFAHLFWVWIAPWAFASVAMQIVIINGLAGGENEDPRLLWALAGVPLLTLAAVALREWTPASWWTGARAWLAGHRKTAWAGGALGTFGLLVVIGLLGEEGPAKAQVQGYRISVAQVLVAGSVGAALAIGACYVTMVDRIKRIVVPMIAVGLFAWLFTAAVLAMALLGALPDWAVVPGALACLALAWLPATFALSWIGLAYERKLFSDAQFQVFAWMLAIAGVVIAIETLVNEAQLFDPLSRWLLGATVLALLGYWLATRYLVRPIAANKRLLVLRVFSKDGRSERLLDEIEYRWRFVGPIVLIGGPDTAARTIDPAKAAQFLRRRLRDTFVPSVHELHKRVAALDEHPDPDGRYRVNEFFCFDDLWKDAVQLLLDSSDAVVLDLRGFTAQRGGTAYELGLLMQRRALARTVLLVDDSTDMLAVRVALGVGPREPVDVGGLIRGESALHGTALIEALVHCVDTARRGADEGGTALRAAA